nr:metal-sulfur cluster assembly factor [Actinomyces minihominis]
MGHGEIAIFENGAFPAEDVIESLKDVIDPELGINIVDLGLLYGVRINEDNSIDLDMTLTSAACPLTDVIERQVAMVLGSYTDDVRLQWVWLPPWGPECITTDGRDQLRAIGFNI